MYPRIKILRKWLAIVLVLFLLLSSLPFSAFATDENEVVFYIDKKFYQKGDQIVETDVAPYIKNGRTMVPVAFVAPALGTDPAQWFPKDRMVLVNKDQDQIAIFIDSKELMVNSEKLQMDVAAEIKDIGGGGGRTMLPIAFIARALDVVYEWVETTRSVHFYGDLIYDQPGTIGPDTGVKTLKGNVIVKAPDVKLQNLIIKDNLIIAQEVGEGDVYLENIQVLGTTFIRSNGFLKLSQGTVLNEVIINSKNIFNNQGRIIKATGPYAEESQFKGNLPENFPKPIVYSGGSGGGSSSSPSTVKVTGVSIVGGNQSVNLDSTLQLTASVTPANATNKGVTWHSSDGAIALVSGDGLVSGIGPGTVTIWATTVDGGFKSEVLITVHEPSEFAGGDGTIEDPYQVATAEQLDKVRSHLDKNFIQIADIDLGVAPWNEGQGWQPIGTETTAFTGFYDGAGYKINNLTIDRPEEQRVGLFGYISNAELNNMSIINGNVIGSSQVGILVGESYTSSKIKYVSVKGNVIGSSQIGGIVGRSYYGTIEDCHAQVTMVTEATMVGGIVGSNGNGNIIRCSAEVNVTGSGYLGGIIGSNSYADIEECYAIGSISGYYALGGIVGKHWYGAVKNNHAHVNVTSPRTIDDYVGGLIGMLDYGEITTNYSTGVITANTGSGPYTFVGGLIGRKNPSGPVPPTVTYGYYDRDTSTRSDNDGRGIPKTTSEMKTITTFAGFDFTSVWGINPAENNGYPFLRWQGYAHIEPTSDFAGGNGTIENPYQVATAEQLNRVRNHLDKHFIQTANIDLGVAPWNDGWEPIGDYFYNPFTGNYNGNGYKIIGLTIDRDNISQVENHGLFGGSFYGTIENVILDNINVDGNSFVGALVGRQLGGSIINCSSEGIVKGANNVGGLVGWIRNGVITGSYTKGEVRTNTNDQYYFGGLAGVLSGNSSLTDCYSTSTVIGDRLVGGLVGLVTDSKVEKSFSTGQVSGNVEIGGLIGAVSGDYQVLNSYYDKETSGIEYDWKGEPKTTAQMKHRVNYIGWNFTDIWGFNPCENDGYPFLRWQGYEHINDFAGGDGTVANPYQVATSEQLDKVRDYLDYHFIQTADLDLGVAPWSSGDGWVPIGSTNFHSLSGQEFNGSYDGNGYSITGLYINQEDEDYLGLFGATTSGSVLKNIKLENVSITGDEEFGALVGRNHGLIENCSAINVNIQGNDHLGGLVGLNRGTVDTCYTTGTVTGTGYPVGGLVGENYRFDGQGYLGIVSNSFSSVNVSGEEDIGGLIGSDSQGTVTNCFATGNVVAYDDYAGGLVGSAWHTTITDCYATGQVNAGGSSAEDCGGLIGEAVSATVIDCYATGYVYGRSNIGGLIGDDSGSAITRSYATGNVSGTIYATGGLIGYASGSTINQCFALSNVSGRDSVGGLVGLLWFSEINNSYATGSVTGHSEVGGLAGHPNITTSIVNNCYSIGTVSGSSNVGGLIGYNITANNSYYNSDTSNQSDTGKGEPKTTAEMVQMLTYETWDFSNIWGIENNTSYPYLQWQGTENIIYPIVPTVDFIAYTMDIEREDITKTVDTTQLEASVVAAQNLHDGAEEGVEPGQYAIGSKAILQAAIDNAQAVIDAKTSATVEQVAEAEAALRSAVAAFTNALVEQDKEAVIPDEPVAEFDGEIVEIDEMVVELGEQVNME